MTSKCNSRPVQVVSTAFRTRFRCNGHLDWPAEVGVGVRRQAAPPPSTPLGRSESTRCATRLARVSLAGIGRLVALYGDAAARERQGRRIQRNALHERVIAHSLAFDRELVPLLDLSESIDLRFRQPAAGRSDGPSTSNVVTSTTRSSSQSGFQRTMACSSRSADCRLSSISITPVTMATGV